MKGFNILLVVLFVGFTALGQGKTETVDKNSFGTGVEETNVLTTDEMMDTFGKLSVNDRVHTKFKGRVKEVCQAKGCWMTLQLTNGQEAMVRFKDYAFFMPKDISGKEVIVDGFAFVEEMSVDDQKHYAKDGGATEKEIAMITKPKKTYGFEASGVLIKD